MISNITVYCSSASITPMDDGEVQIYLQDIDMNNVLNTVTNKFTLKQILSAFDDEVIGEYFKENM